jgi:hypothetical protein
MYKTSWKKVGFASREVWNLYQQPLLPKSFYATSGTPQGRPLIETTGPFALLPRRLLGILFFIRAPSAQILAWDVVSYVNNANDGEDSRNSDPGVR